MANTIKLRRGTAAQWTSANSVLADGEPGFETDTNKFKIGTGTASWNDLPYSAIDPATASATYLPISASSNYLSKDSASATYLRQDSASAIYATIDSPSFSGTPLAPTAASGTNTTQIATTQFVRGEVSNLVGSAPETLDTLNELAAALGNDANFSTTVTNSLAAKLDSSTASTLYLPISGSVNWSNINDKPDPVITLGGDLSGSVTLTDLASGTLTATVEDDSHNHIISNVDGLQDALDAKAPISSPTFTGTPSTPTASVDTNTTQIATTAYVVGQGYLKSDTASSTYIPLSTPTTGTASIVYSNHPTLLRPLLQSPQELATVSATQATASINYDVLSQTVLYYTSSAIGNWHINVRGNSSNTLSSLLEVGESITLVFGVDQGTTAYYQLNFMIDGTQVVPRWQGGSAPTGGNISGTDVYSYSIVKTDATPTYRVFASLTGFA